MGSHMGNATLQHSTLDNTMKNMEEKNTKNIENMKKKKKSLERNNLFVASLTPLMSEVEWR